MFSLSNDKMNKMTEDNPLLAMMQSAFANDNDSVKKATDAWLKAMPGGKEGSDNDLSAHPMAALAASSAVGMGMYTQMVGTMIGAMSGAMDAAERMKDATEKSDAPFGMFFNPLTFEWSDVKSAEPEQTEAKKKPKKSAPKPKNKADKKQAGDVATPVDAPTSNAAPLELVQAEPVSAEIMPEDFVRPKKIEKPEVPDDLKQIAGVGPKLEQVLNGMGIWTFSQIAQWSPEEIAFVDDYLQFKGRIGRDQWLRQAAELQKNEV